jgi:RNA polymerase sigma factor (sigma-70 family)
MGIAASFGAGSVTDALQSTFASAFRALKAGRRDAPLRPWLFRIAHNHAISALRRRRPQDELTESLASRPSLEEQAAERERLERLVSDLRELSDRQRGALVMRELSGLTHEDIACALDISIGAAKQAVFEARRALAEFAEAERRHVRTSSGSSRTVTSVRCAAAGARAPPKLPSVRHVWGFDPGPPR